MKKMVSFLLLCAMIFAFCSCADTAETLSEGDLLFDCGISSLEAVDSCELEIYDESQQKIEISETEDISFLKHYTYHNDYAADQLHKLFDFPGYNRLHLTADNNSYILYLLEDKSIVVKTTEEGAYRIYTAEEGKGIADDTIQTLSDKYQK